jgi:hypothetical protein
MRYVPAGGRSRSVDVGQGLRSVCAAAGDNVDDLAARYRSVWSVNVRRVLTVC